MPTNAPRWARDTAAERVQHKAARIAALYLMRDRLHAAPKTELAAALGVSRWTLDRDLAALAEVAEHVERITAALAEAEARNQPTI